MTIDTWRCFAMIFSNSFHCQSFGVKRVGQQSLEGFDLPHPAFPCCLCNTQLHPSDMLERLAPIDLVPGPYRLAGGNCVCFLSFRFHASSFPRSSHPFFCIERPDGSLLTFVRGNVVQRLNPYPGHYNPAFAFSILLYLHLHRRALRPFYPVRERYRLTVFCISNVMG